MRRCGHPPMRFVHPCGTEEFEAAPVPPSPAAAPGGPDPFASQPQPCGLAPAGASHPDDSLIQDDHVLIAAEHASDDALHAEASLLADAEAAEEEQGVGCCSDDDLTEYETDRWGNEVPISRAARFFRRRRARAQRDADIDANQSDLVLRWREADDELALAQDQAIALDHWEVAQGLASLDEMRCLRRATEAALAPSNIDEAEAMLD